MTRDPSAAAVVVVGSGHAAVELAVTLRRKGFTGRVVLVGDEGVPLYQRPPLSKDYLRAGDVDRLLLRPRGYFRDNRIDLLDGHVVSLDRGRREIRGDSGLVLPYDVLVLATGARNRRLVVAGREPAGVLHLRTLAEADVLAARLPAARSLVIVGAGFVGLEVAALGWSRPGLKVNVVEMTDRVLARVASPLLSHAVRAVHEEHGVRFHLGGRVAAVGNGSVRLDDGTDLAADLVLAGVGTHPNVELAAQSGLEVDGGVVVDHRLRTAGPAVFAIGDCAAFPSMHSSNPVRLESVQNAVDQARTVAAAIMGESTRYAAVPWFWSDQGSLKLQIAGVAAADDPADLLQGSTPDRPSVLRFRDDTLVAVETLDNPGDHMAARRLLGQGHVVTRRQATSPGFELRPRASHI